MVCFSAHQQTKFPIARVYNIFVGFSAVYRNNNPSHFLLCHYWKISQYSFLICSTPYLELKHFSPINLCHFFPALNLHCTILGKNKGYVWMQSEANNITENVRRQKLHIPIPLKPDQKRTQTIIHSPRSSKEQKVLKTVPSPFNLLTTLWDRLVYKIITAPRSLSKLYGWVQI